MNIFKKIYCRVFQTAFRLALPVLPYRKPQIVGSVRELPDVMPRQSLLLCTDRY